MDLIVLEHSSSKVIFQTHRKRGRAGAPETEENMRKALSFWSVYKFAGPGLELTSISLEGGLCITFALSKDCLCVATGKTKEVLLQRFLEGLIRRIEENNWENLKEKTRFFRNAHKECILEAQNLVLNEFLSALDLDKAGLPRDLFVLEFVDSKIGDGHDEEREKTRGPEPTEVGVLQGRGCCWWLGAFKTRRRRVGMWGGPAATWEHLCDKGSLLSDAQLEKLEKRLENLRPFQEANFPRVKTYKNLGCSVVFLRSLAVCVPLAWNANGLFEAALFHSNLNRLVGRLESLVDQN